MSAVIALYPETTCPLCELRPGTPPGLCHLLPTESDPVGVLVYFQVCGRCDCRVRGASGEAHKELSRDTVRFFDRWLELEYGQDRGTA